jgi:hypothetical protein
MRWEVTSGSIGFEEVLAPLLPARITDLGPAPHGHAQGKRRTGQVRIPLRTLFFPAPQQNRTPAVPQGPAGLCRVAAPVLHVSHAYQNGRGLETLWVWGG